MNDKWTGRALGEVLTALVFLTILAVGISIIVGWHLHIPFLIQVLPGAIPMRYNTALCFIVLALSGWTFIRYEYHRLVPVMGGAFVAAMGAVVIFQYLTGISLGIDTAFFTPWEQTLNSHPGRMALTTALSFIVAGGALIHSTLSHRRLAVLAMAHILPMSFGLIALMGYLYGVTYVLPFHLGTQMAIHTALMFTAYGGAMIVYAWRQAIKANREIPLWGFAIITITIPVLFVGFTFGAQKTSLLAQALQFLVGLAVITLIGFAVSKMDGWQIRYKGLVMIAVPLCIMLLFVAFVLRLNRQNEAAQAQALHSKEVLAQTQLVLRILVDAETAMRGYVISSDQRFIAPYRRSELELPLELEKLYTLVADNPMLKEQAQRIGEKAAGKMAFTKKVEQLVRVGQSEEAARRVRTGEGRERMEDIRQEIALFLEEEARLDDLQQQTLAASRQQVNRVMIAGVSASILLIMLLAFMFSRGINRRLVILSENAEALAEGKKLSLPLQGYDEIAQLDKTFHRMAEALESAAQKERALIENATDVICSSDAAGNFVKVNAASLKVWGYRPEEIVGQHYNKFVVPEDLERSEEKKTDILQGQALTDFENKYRCRDGTEVWMAWSASWSESEQLIFCIGRDITAKKRAEDLIEKQKADLEKTAAELTAVNKELEAFSYSVSHDLRAPLRHIDGFANMLQKSAAATLDEKSRHYLNIISASAKQMGQLIDDLLAFSRIGRAEKSITTVNLDELVRQIQSDLQHDLNGRKVIWQIHPLPQVLGDPAMLKLVVMNLLSNALKYTRNRAEAHIEVGNLNEHPEQATIFVRDNGAGFDMRYVDKLFGVFQRLHSTSEFEGTGIGLANVQRIIHRHGGKTWAEGKVDDGATFYFSLPIARKG